MDKTITAHLEFSSVQKVIKSSGCEYVTLTQRFGKARDHLLVTVGTWPYATGYLIPCTELWLIADIFDPSAEISRVEARLAALSIPMDSPDIEALIDDVPITLIGNPDAILTLKDGQGRWALLSRSYAQSADKH